jgi:hypothetical protein
MERSFFVMRKSIIYLMTARRGCGILIVAWAIDLMGWHVCIFGEVENWVLFISFAPAVGGAC